MDSNSKPKRPGRIFLIISALMYLALGILFLINPAGMAGGIGFSGLDKNALTEVSASFGGLWAGIGAYLAICIKNHEIETGLKVVFWTFAGFALGRAVASARFTGFYGLHCYWISFELAWTLAAFSYIKRAKQCDQLS